MGLKPLLIDSEHSSDQLGVFCLIVLVVLKASTSAEKVEKLKIK